MQEFAADELLRKEQRERGDVWVGRGAQYGNVTQKIECLDLEKEERCIYSNGERTCSTPATYSDVMTEILKELDKKIDTTLMSVR